jgi:hypothetical protein
LYFFLFTAATGRILSQYLTAIPVSDQPKIWAQSLTAQRSKDKQE